MKRWLVALWMLLATLPAVAVQLTKDAPEVSLRGHLEHFEAKNRPLPFDAIRQERFTTLPDFRSLGYDTNDHWFRIILTRDADAPPRWVLSIGMPELEEVDVWVEQLNGAFIKHELGYHRPYENRPLQTRLFAVPVDVSPSAVTEVLFRVRTTNAINVSAELWQPSAFVANETKGNFYRGAYFGILLIAVLLYAILGIRLRDVTMAAYAGYAASMALFHLGSNGYLPVLLTSHQSWFSDALPRIGWLGGSISIALLWDKLLDLRQHFRRIHRLFLFTIFLNLALLLFAVMPFLVTASLLYVVKLANVLNSLNFFIGIVLALVFWRRSRRVELLLYFVAFVIPALGTLINNAANQGYLPQGVVTSYLYQIAPLIHVLVMSFGLALRLRQLQHDKTTAEHEAAVAAQRTEEQRRFVAMLSHEFRNPLAAIDRATQMVQFKTPTLPPPEAERLSQIRANVTTLSGFVDNFLMTEALEHGGLPLSREECAIRPFLENAIRQQGEAAERRIALRVSPDDARHSLDVTLMNVAIGNLLANALRYSPEDSPVEVIAEQSEQGLRIEVKDHGPGVEPDELPRLGTPYFRAASSIGKKGSGLGYHFTQRIVSAHGGRMTARSQEDEGLTVGLVLP
ncbi:sensor histidine kinase [Herbaspirillum sp.]|uniref:sensor histidine kinase n=1 Tax=Herbaspirillum sp. TaxID=1890675 RepID=UPI001B18FD10|nr:sensor histidine kinase [Herbaspirillum sp.]MBO9538092.1 sensor histidine kinase [Herbaspirillum sp.]